MGITLEQDQESTRICLDATIDISSAAELKKTLMETLRRGKAVRLDLGKVSEIDVTGVQLLSAAERQARLTGIEFSSASAFTASVASGLRALGFEGFPVNAKGM